ncbi:MAG TPA: CHAT domain-containing protein, partial [Phycicoccus sp.]|nr:CHAT domain-containing protein [Phycicoccus sp.]
ERANEFLRAADTLTNRGSTHHQREAASASLKEVCRWLWNVVAEPVLNHLGSTDPVHDDRYESWPRMWWIPTGPLTVLPLHAAGHHDRPGQSVIDRVISSTIPTIETLRARRTPSATLPADESAPTDKPGAKALLVGMSHTPPGPQLDLPGVARELGLVKKRLSAVDVVELATGRGDVPAPTKALVTQHLPSAAWVHLACHAGTDPFNPTRSTLYLTDHQDDPFTVADLIDTVTDTGQVMFLSACTTARPGLRTLDDPVHFAAAALLAGYRHVIATLWPLLDDTAPFMAEAIYAGLTRNGRPTSWAGDHAAIAVHRAVRDQRALRPEDIFRWATYTHYGP